MRRHPHLRNPDKVGLPFRGRRRGPLPREVAQGVDRVDLEHRLAQLRRAQGQALDLLGDGVLFLRRRRSSCIWFIIFSSFFVPISILGGK